MTSLRQQRDNIHCLVDDCEPGGALSLMIGPHLLAIGKDGFVTKPKTTLTAAPHIASVATVYCSSVCREMAYKVALQDHRIRSDWHDLQQEYLSILDSLKRIVHPLAVPLCYNYMTDPFANSGDMRLLYRSISRFIDGRLSAALSDRTDLPDAGRILSDMSSFGYLGLILAESGQQD